MEYIDVLNENGVKTGEVTTRDDVHKKGLWHRIALAVVINLENKILIQQRSEKCKKFPGLWDLSVACHVQAGEDSLSTLTREINEEIGLQLEYKAQVKDFRFLTSFKNQHTYQNSKGETLFENQFYDLFVWRKDISLNDLNFNDNEVSEVKWADYTIIQKLLKENKLHPRTEWINEVNRYINKF